jgi:hypothetical protein
LTSQDARQAGDPGLLPGILSKGSYRSRLLDRSQVMAVAEVGAEAALSSPSEDTPIGTETLGRLLRGLRSFVIGLGLITVGLVGGLVFALPLLSPGASREGVINFRVASALGLFGLIACLIVGAALVLVAYAGWRGGTLALAKGAGTAPRDSRQFSITALGNYRKAMGVFWAQLVAGVLLGFWLPSLWVGLLTSGIRLTISAGPLFWYVVLIPVSGVMALPFFYFAFRSLEASVRAVCPGGRQADRSTALGLILLGVALSTASGVYPLVVFGYALGAIGLVLTLLGWILFYLGLSTSTVPSAPAMMGSAIG